MIGINYKGTSAALSGCINDANNVKNFLMSRFNYKLEDMVILTDDARDPRQMPTRQNVSPINTSSGIEPDLVRSFRLSRSRNAWRVWV